MVPVDTRGKACAASKRVRFAYRRLVTRKGDSRGCVFSVKSEGGGKNRR